MSYKDNPFYIQESIDKQKAIAQKIILDLNAFGFPGAVCAGGAPRDWFLGKIAKDLDFFVDFTSTFKPESFFKFMGIDSVKDLQQSEMYESNPRLKQVLEFEFRNQKCQLVIVQKTDSEVKAWSIHETFPVNVSKAVYRNDGYGGFKIEYTEDFKYGHEYKILDFNLDYLYNERYKKKIRRKFKDYALVLRKKTEDLFIALED